MEHEKQGGDQSPDLASRLAFQEMKRARDGLQDLYERTGAILDRLDAVLGQSGIVFEKLDSPAAETVPELEKVPCRTCRRPIVFGVSVPVEGKGRKRIPLDPTPPTYRWTPEGWERANGRDVAEPVLVTHFATCPQASQHSKGERGTRG